MPPMSRSSVLFAIFSALTIVLMMRDLATRPTYTDAYYHYNAALRLARGDGLVDDYLWTYIGAPPQLPSPSHLYWMPLTSVLAAGGMWFLNGVGVYSAAQAPFFVLFWWTTWVGYGLGYALGHQKRHAWLAGLLTLFSGYFARYWGAIDTFAPYALWGSLALVIMGRGVVAGQRRLDMMIWSLAGGLSALGHLTRADGLLLLAIGLIVLWWPWQNWRAKGYITRRLLASCCLCLAYLVVMMPYFVRNWSQLGVLLPLGGTQAIWFTEYNDLFSYPSNANPQTFFADGLGLLFSTRWEAFTNNVLTFVAVEGQIVLTPLMFVGLWRRRHHPFLRPFILYMLGLHVAMTFVFPFPGYRGGLFHSAAALVPWWAALGAVGLDDVIEWAAKRRRWRVQSARLVFSTALVVLAFVLTVFVLRQGRAGSATPSLYVELARHVPTGSRVMINDPAQLYYFTGLGGVVLPNEEPSRILEIARQYDVQYLLLEEVQVSGYIAAAPTKLQFDVDNPPDFLQPIALNNPTVRLYAIVQPPAS